MIENSVSTQGEKRKRKSNKPKLSKIEEYRKYSRRVNAHLYEDGLIAGYDYIECPISKIRFSVIKYKFIVNVLEMKLEDYPDIPRSSGRRIENIKKGIKVIDEETGLTKHEICVMKSREKLSEVGDDGLSGYERKALKTYNTHTNKVDEFGRNGYQRQAHARVTTVLENGLTVEQNAHIKRDETLAKTFKTGSGGASKLSKKVLKPIIELLEEFNVKYYFDTHEYVMTDPDTKKTYFWDLALPDYKMVIEYQSSAWHANPSLPDDEWYSWKPPKGIPYSAEEALRNDYVKARSIFKHKGFVSYFVYQRSQEIDVENIICTLKTMFMK